MECPSSFVLHHLTLASSCSHQRFAPLVRQLVGNQLLNLNFVTVMSVMRFITKIYFAVSQQIASNHDNLYRTELMNISFYLHLLSVISSVYGAEKPGPILCQTSAGNIYHIQPRGIDCTPKDGIEHGKSNPITARTGKLH